MFYFLHKSVVFANDLAGVCFGRGSSYFGDVYQKKFNHVFLCRFLVTGNRTFLTILYNFVQFYTTFLLLLLWRNWCYVHALDTPATSLVLCGNIGDDVKSISDMVISP